METNPSVSLDQLKLQLKTLESDEKHFKEKLFGVMGAKKVIQFMIDEIEKNEVPQIEGVNGNG